MSVVTLILTGLIVAHSHFSTTPEPTLLDHRGLTSPIEYKDYSDDWDCSEESYYTGKNECDKQTKHGSLK